MDVNGCVGATANEYTVDAPDHIVIAGTASGILCNGDSNGAVSFSGEGGNGGLVSLSMEVRTAMDFLWRFGPRRLHSHCDNVEGCMAETTFNVADIEAVAATATASAISCNGETDGSVELAQQVERAYLSTALTA